MAGVGGVLGGTPKGRFLAKKLGAEKFQRLDFGGSHFPLRKCADFIPQMRWEGWGGLDGLCFGNGNGF